MYLEVAGHGRMCRAQIEGQVWLRHLLGESMAHQMQGAQAIQDL